MAMPISTTPRTNPSHAMLHSSLHQNVKAHGAVGDGVTNDTTAIQAAINAADAFGSGHVYFPPGDYLVTSTLAWNNGWMRFSGGANRNVGGPLTSWPGVRVLGSINGPLFSKTGGNESIVVFEDMAILNQHSTGTAINLDGYSPGSMISRCTISGYKGLTNVGSQNGFGLLVIETAFRPVVAATVAGANGIDISAGHLQVISCDFQGFNKGLNIVGVQNLVINGCRIETCEFGIVTSGGARGEITSCYFEANDTGIYIDGTGSILIAGIRFHGSVGAPSGQSLIGLNIGTSVLSSTFMGISDSGTHSTGVFNIQSGNHTDCTFISCTGNNAGWVLPSDKTGLQFINCSGSGMTNIIRAPVIATGSLPAAAAGENGRLVIEDNGSGDRNLILYAGGQRFRIDGGSAI